MQGSDLPRDLGEQQGRQDQSASTSNLSLQPLTSDLPADTSSGLDLVIYSPTDQVVAVNQPPTVPDVSPAPKVLPTAGRRSRTGSDDHEAFVPFQGGHAWKRCLILSVILASMFGVTSWHLHVWDRAERLSTFSTVTGTGIICTLLVLFASTYIMLWNSMAFVLRKTESRVIMAITFGFCLVCVGISVNQTPPQPPTPLNFHGCEVVTEEVQEYWKALCPNRQIGTLQTGPALSCPGVGEDSFASLMTSTLGPSEVRSTFATLLPLVSGLIPSKAINSTACGIAVTKLTCETMLPLCTSDCKPVEPSIQTCLEVNSACQNSQSNSQRWLAGYLVQLHIVFPNMPSALLSMITAVFDATYDCKQPTPGQSTQLTCMVGGQDDSWWFKNSTLIDAEMQQPGICNTANAAASISRFTDDERAFQSQMTTQEALNKAERYVIGAMALFLWMYPYMLLAAQPNKRRMHLQKADWFAYLNGSVALGATAGLMLSLVLMYVAAFVADDTLSPLFLVLGACIWIHSLFALCALPQNLLSLSRKRSRHKKHSSWLLAQWLSSVAGWYAANFGFFKGKHFTSKLLAVELLEYGIQLSSIFSLASEISSWEILGYIIFLNVNVVVVSVLSMSNRPELFRDMNLAVDIVFDIAFSVFNLLIRREQGLDIVFALVLIVPAVLHMERLNTIKNATVSQYASSHIEAIHLQRLQTNKDASELQVFRPNDIPGVPRTMKALLIVLSVLSTVLTVTFALQFNSQHQACLKEGGALWHRTVPQIYFPDGLLRSSSCKTSGVTVLHITDEGVDSVNSFLTRYTDLTSFSARGNRLQSVPEDALRLPSIQEVDLRDNQIAYVSPSLEDYWNSTIILLDGNPFALHVNFDSESPPLTEIPTRILSPLRNSIKTISAKDNHLLRFPATLRSFRVLDEIDFSHNNLSTFSMSFIGTDSVHLVNISYNHITRISAEQLSSRREMIDASYNRISKLPEQFGSLLTPFNVTGNLVTELSFGIALAGLPSLNPGYCALPIVEFFAQDQRYPSIDSVACLKELQVVRVSECALTDLGPLFFSTYRPELTSIDFRLNQLTVLPAEIGVSANRVSSILLHRNALTTLPDSIGNMTLLTSFDARDNKITAFPQGWQQLTALAHIELQDNHITNIPESIGALTSLSFLRLDNNRLTSLPFGMGQLTAMTTLRVYDNPLLQLPPSLGQLSSMTLFYSMRCNLTNVPVDLFNATSLQYLRLYNNFLTSLPDALGQLTALKDLRLQANSITALPPTMGNLTSMEVLYIHNNRLEALPSSMQSLSSLKTLYMYGNNLTAPNFLFALPSLRTLRLDRSAMPSGVVIPSALTVTLVD